MPPKSKSAFAGGWSQAKSDAVNAIQLPPKIRCSVCKKHKNGDLFSKKQLLDLRHHIYLNFEIKQSPIRCRTCTASQTHEMHCCICGEVKGLDAFSKAQRRTPDKARCQECVNAHLSLRPGYEGWEGSSEDDDSDDSTNMLTNNYESQASWQPTNDVDGISSSMQMLTTENLKQHFGGEAHNIGASETVSSVVSSKGKGPARTEGDADVGGWQIYAKSNGRVNTQRPTEFTGYDPHGNAHHQVRAPSTVGSENDRIGHRFAKIHAPPPKKSSRFAKPPREPMPPPPPPTTSVFVGKTVHYSDDDDSDEEWGVLP